MHSTGMTFALRTIIDRPCRSFAYAVSSGRVVTSAEIRWFGMSRIRSNQKSEICVRTSPLRGTPQGMTTSKALIRSVATKSSASPRS